MIRSIVLTVAAAAVFASVPASARGNHVSIGGGHSYSGRVHYSGLTHTVSHGGAYVGSPAGSSHRGGHYSNARTGSRYGCHQC
jgi:hypothetical protein